MSASATESNSISRETSAELTAKFEQDSCSGPVAVGVPVLVAVGVPMPAGVPVTAPVAVAVPVDVAVAVKVRAKRRTVAGASRTAREGPEGSRTNPIVIN